MKDFEDVMTGIECRHSKELIDELPMAYKDIDEVMENSKDLVAIKHTLRQVVNVKGDCEQPTMLSQRDRRISIRTRRVHGPVRCWQHKGMPAMLPQDKLIVKE